MAIVVPNKDVFTTGEVARITGMFIQTINRCFDKGKFEGGYKVPGSTHRRIPRKALLNFLKDNNFEILDQSPFLRRVLLIEADETLSRLFVHVLERDGRLEIKTATSTFGAGLIAMTFIPDLILLRESTLGLKNLSKVVRSTEKFAHTKIALLSNRVTGDNIRDLTQLVDHVFYAPLDLGEILPKVEYLLELPASPFEPSRS
jgi:hypothetical protein